MDTGFVLALPFHRGDLELDRVGLSTKDHAAILVAWPWLGGVYLQDKNTCARTSTENVGGGGAYMWDAMILKIFLGSWFAVLAH